MTRRLGRCTRGLRLLAPVRHGHWKTTTLVAGLRTTGITAPYVLDGAVTGDIFRAYVEQILAPTLSPGDIVVQLAVAFLLEAAPDPDQEDPAAQAIRAQLAAAVAAVRDHIADGTGSARRCGTRRPGATTGADPDRATRR